MQYKPARLFNIQKALRGTVPDIAKLEYYYFLKLSNEHSLSLETFIDLVEYNLVFNTTYKGNQSNTHVQRISTDF